MRKQAQGHRLNDLLRTRGASMIEFALVLPPLVILLVIIVDIARYWGVQGLLNQGAQRAVNFAVKSPEVTGSADSQAFQRTKRRIINMAASLASTSLVNAVGSSEGSVKFVGIKDQSSNQTLPAALLRPGECVTDDAGTQHCHPTVCPQSGTCSSLLRGARRMKSNESMQSLLDANPLVVVMPVSFKPLLPLATFRPHGMAGGYLQILRSGPYPIPGKGQVAEIPPPNSSPTPTSTPGAAASPTPQVGPTPTRTPRPSPTPDCNRNPPIDCGLHCLVCSGGAWRCVSSGCGGG